RCHVRIRLAARRSQYPTGAPRYGSPARLGQNRRGPGRVDRLPASLPRARRGDRVSCVLRVAALLLIARCSLPADLGPELIAAARKGQTARVEELAAQGVSVESQDKQGRTALMMAAQNGHAATVRALLARGAKPERRDREGWTAYALALTAGRD